MEASYEALASRSRSVDGAPTSMADIGFINANVDDAWQSCDYTCSAKHGNPPKFPAVNSVSHISHLSLISPTFYQDILFDEVGGLTTKR
jgi:hypothetical protein